VLLVNLEKKTDAIKTRGRIQNMDDVRVLAFGLLIRI
jgi:hypothetical protein